MISCEVKEIKVLIDELLKRTAGVIYDKAELMAGPEEEVELPEEELVELPDEEELEEISELEFNRNDNQAWQGSLGLHYK